MSTLLVIFAHPDDEGGASGVMALAAAAGARVVLACATRGEVGEISDPALATAETLGAVREQELRAACEILGAELRFLGYRDSGMAGTPANEDPRSYLQADPEAAVRQLVTLIREIRPQIVITFDPSGGYGHPDHVTVHRHATTAFDLAGDAAAFADAGPAWRPQRLLYAVLPRTWFLELRDLMEKAGLDTAFIDQFLAQDSDFVDGDITHQVDVRDQIDAKIAALRCHHTQFGPEHPLARLPEEMMRDWMATEFFIQARPSPPATAGIVTVNDLFEPLEGWEPAGG